MELSKIRLLQQARGSTTTRTGVVLLAVAMVMSSCGGSSGPSGSDVASSDAGTSAAATATVGSSVASGSPAPATSGPSTSAAASGETDATLPLPNTTPGPEEFGLTKEELTLRIEAVEALVGTCMKQAGFQYIPNDFKTVQKAMSADKSAPGLSDDQYLEQYGFGITTQLDKPLVAFGAGPENNKILAGLSATDQVAYKRTLWGDKPEWTLVRAIEEEDFSETQGCVRSSAAQKFRPDELTGSYVNPGDRLIAQDKRMVAALKKWSACVHDKGFPEYAKPDALEQDLAERLAAILQGRNPSQLIGAEADALKELQGEERAVAKVSVDCEDEHIAEVESQVEAEIYGARQN